MTEHTPLFAARGFSIGGQDFLPGDELPTSPTLVERGLATTDPVRAAALRELAAPARRRRTARESDFAARLAELREAAEHPWTVAE